MHMFDNHIEKPRSVGRPKLADTKLKKSALILLSMSFVIVITLLLTFGYQLNIIPSLNKLKGVVECSDGDIPVELRYDEETNPNGFKDVNFYSDVINSMNATSCDNVAAADLAEINSINLYNKKYSSINGIQYLTNLERLSVDKSSVTGEIDLSENKLLKRISMYQNEITKITLPEDNSIEYIDLDNNKLTEIDLSDTKNLEYLDLHNNKLSGEMDLSDLSNIGNLNLSYNEIENITGLSSNESIISLSLSNNKLKQYDISGNINIDTFDISNNELESIIINNNNVKNVYANNNENIETFDVGNSTNLSMLNVSGNKNLKTINISGAPNISYLNMNNYLLKTYYVKLGESIQYVPAINVISPYPENDTCYLSNTNYVTYSNGTITGNVWSDYPTNLYCKYYNPNKNNNNYLTITSEIYVYKVESSAYTVNNEEKTINFGNKIIGNTSTVKRNITGLSRLNIRYNGNIMEIVDPNDDTNVLDRYTMQDYKLYELTSDVYDVQENTIDVHNQIFHLSELTFNGDNAYTSELNGDEYIIKDPNGEVYKTYQIINKRQSNSNAYIESGFNDQNLYQCVLKKYDEDVEEMYTLTDKELSTITKLNCSGKEITDTTGLEKLTGLNELILSDNLIENIDLSNNKKIRVLHLYNNKLNEVGGLDELYDLSELEVSKNNLTELDLSKNAFVSIVFASDNPNLSEIKGLNNKYSLGGLVLNNTSIKYLDIKDIPGLYMLSIFDTKISDPLYVLKGAKKKYHERVILNSNITYSADIVNNEVLKFEDNSLLGNELGTTSVTLKADNIISIPTDAHQLYSNCKAEGDNDSCVVTFMIALSGSGNVNNNIITNDVNVYDISSEEYKINKTGKSIDIGKKEFDPYKVTLSDSNLTGEVINNKYVIKDLNGNIVDKFSFITTKPAKTTTSSTTTKKTTTTKKVEPKIITKIKNILGPKKKSIINKVIPIKEDDIIIYGPNVNMFALVAAKGKDRNIIVNVDDNLKVIINGRNINGISGSIDLSYTLTSIKDNVKLSKAFKNGVVLKFNNPSVNYNMLLEINLGNNYKDYIDSKGIDAYKIDDNYIMIGKDLKVKDNKLVVYINSLDKYVFTNQLNDTKNFTKNKILIAENRRVQQKISNITMFIIMLDVIIALIIIVLIKMKPSKDKKIEA